MSILREVLDELTEQWGRQTRAWSPGADGARRGGAIGRSSLRSGSGDRGDGEIGVPPSQCGPGSSVVVRH